MHFLKLPVTLFSTFSRYFVFIKYIRSPLHLVLKYFQSVFFLGVREKVSAPQTNNVNKNHECDYQIYVW